MTLCHAYASSVKSFILRRALSARDLHENGMRWDGVFAVAVDAGGEPKLRCLSSPPHLAKYNITHPTRRHRHRTVHSLTHFSAFLAAQCSPPSPSFLRFLLKSDAAAALRRPSYRRCAHEFYTMQARCDDVVRRTPVSLSPSVSPLSLSLSQVSTHCPRI